MFYFWRVPGENLSDVGRVTLVHVQATRSVDTLSVHTVIQYLRERGVIGDDRARARELGGGISNVVLRVDSGLRTLVVKQALSQLRVAETWEFDPRRILIEAACLQLLASGLPAGSVPEVLDVDEQRLAFTMTSAPAGAVVWKDALLAGDIDVTVAQRAGRLLAAIHSPEIGRPDVAERFDDLMPLIQGRIEPYHRTTARVHPDLAAHVNADVQRLLSHRRALVLGDFSPKNLLVYPDRLLALDFEVAHWGDPSFDTAFLLTHLVAKAMHRPDQADAYLGAARAFWATYRDARVPTAASEADTAVELAVLMLCRADGKSPLEYLSPTSRKTLRELARELIWRGDGSLETVWQAAAQAAGAHR